MTVHNYEWLESLHYAHYTTPLRLAQNQVLRLDDDGSWDAVSSLISGQSGSNVASYTFGRYFQGVAGETYKIQVTFCCIINNSSEFKSYTSGRITAK